jgi:hypothetical protein
LNEGATWDKAVRATQEGVLKEVAMEVDFFNWGIPRREIQYVRSAVLLATSALPIIVATMMHLTYL